MNKNKRCVGAPGSLQDAFSRVLIAARRASGLSQEGLAEAAQIDRTYPSMLESGMREPKLSTFVRLAVALGVEPTQMLEATLAMQANRGRQGVTDTPVARTAEPKGDSELANKAMLAAWEYSEQYKP
jgi:transcriptional regulator with XRE-family HTH domain